MDIFAFIHTSDPTKSRRQETRKSVVVDAGRVSHPPKKLRGDHGTPSGASIGASVSAMLEREDGHHTKSVAEPNLHTIRAPSSILIMTAVTTITLTVDPTLVTKEKFVSPYPFGAGSSTAGETDPIAGVFSDLIVFASVCKMEHDQLFTEFNVEAALQMSLSAEVRMRAEYNVKEKRRLKEAEAVEAIRLRAEASSFETIHELEMSSGELQEKVTIYENFMKQLERFQDDRMKVVNDKFDKLYTEFVEMALHLEEKFYPHLLTTIYGRRWLLTQGMKLAIVKCLNSPEYISALGAAISKAIKKGMQDGLSVGITHGKEGRVLMDVAAYNPSAKVDYISALQQLQNVNFLLLAELKSNKDASIEAVINILRLKEPLADKSVLDELQPNVD
nr:transposase (putative), gypsy type [Tanacetum cinerariifolium]